VDILTFRGRRTQAYIAWVGILTINPCALYPYMSFRNLTAMSFELRL
jgi:hypothetical protein